MSTPAAFFDLDRTLLRGASGPILTGALRAAGVISERVIPGENLLYRLFNAVGENRPAMLLARQGARFSKGQKRTDVQHAGELAAELLVPMVGAYAQPVIEKHREEGRPVVLATTSPYDLVKPFADQLGLDDVIATRYGTDSDGHYDGTINGHFVWGPGKLSACEEWAEANGVDLDESWAYSDSFYDIPLLSAVAHPRVVNPDPRMFALATLRRWPIRYLDKPEGVPKLLGLVEPAEALLPFARPELVPYARFDIAGTENIPPEGGCIVVANHRSYFDTLAMALTISKTGRPVRFLGKKEVFDAPVVGQLATAMGGIRVERGSGSDEPLRAAAEAVEAGELITLMPQGTIPRGPAFFDPELKGRWGAAKLAAMTKAPVIPVGMWGTEQVWPRSSRLPNLLNVTNPPLVTVRVGEPVDLKYRSPDPDTKRIMAAISELLPKESRKKRTPTAEELARTYPPGYEGDPESELERRPGTDT
ncbi:MAG TPA: HAD-IB family hydrolase [Acidimicrobiaceae bacterium]|nr:HAD-IB family hydrolase [Acidimicrobiaceae bacterium]